MITALIILLIGCFFELFICYYGIYRANKVYKLRGEIIKVMSNRKDYMELGKVYDSVSFDYMVDNIMPIKLESYYPKEFCEAINNAKW